MRTRRRDCLSTIAVAIDQILRLAPSIRPPIEAGGVQHEGDFDGGLATAAEGRP